MHRTLCGRILRARARVQLSAAALLWLVPAAVGGAQPAAAIRIAGTPACPRCTIERDLVVTLRGNDSALIRERPTVARDRRGRYFVPDVTPSVLAFDSAGRFIARIGRRGQGPGEFPVGITDIFTGSDDSLYVLGSGARELSVFGADLRFARHLQVPGWGQDNVVLPVGIVRHMTVGRVGFDPYGIYLTNAAGEVARTLREPDSMPPRPGDGRPCAACTSRTLAAGREGRTVWTASRSRYEIEQIDVDGRLQRRVVVLESRWLITTAAESGADAPYGSTRPGSGIRGVAEALDGRLWVAGTTTALDWKPLENPPARPTGRGISRIPPDVVEHGERYRATIIDLLDPRTGRLLVSHRFDHEAIELLGGDLAWAAREDADGNTLIDVWRLRVVEAR